MRKALPLLCLAALSACTAPDEAATSPAGAALRAGTEVNLLLATPLSSGGSKEGEPVHFIVSEPVVDESGNVLIPAGAPARGVVVWSRGATTFTALANQPARLAISLTSTTSVDGGEVALCAHKDQPDEVLRFGRNDGGTTRSAEIDALWKNERVRNGLVALYEAMRTGSAPEGTARQDVELAVRELGLDDAERTIEGDGLSALIGALSRARAGEALQLAAPELSLLFSTLTELGSVVNDVGDRIAGMLKGANIRIPVGKRLTVYVAESTSVRIRP